MPSMALFSTHWQSSPAPAAALVETRPVVAGSGRSSGLRPAPSRPGSKVRIFGHRWDLSHRDIAARLVNGQIVTKITPFRAREWWVSRYSNIPDLIDWTSLSYSGTRTGRSLLDYSYPLQTGIPTFFRFDHVINFPSSAGAYRGETAPHVVQLSVSYLARLGSMWGYRDPTKWTDPPTKRTDINPIRPSPPRCAETR
jgi:hypothetical protein